MKLPGTHPARVLLLLALLAGLMSLPASAQFETPFHLIPTSASIAGPNGDAVSASAHVGETVTVHVMVWNLDSFFDSIAIQRVSLVIHHARGDVHVPNLTPHPVVISNYGDFADITTSFVIQPEDGDVVRVDAELLGTDNWESLAPGSPMAFQGAWTLQVQVGKPSVAVFQQCEASASHPFLIISGSVTNTGNCRLENVWVISDGGTPEDASDDFPIHLENLEPKSAVSCGEIIVPSGGGSLYTMTVRATDPLGWVVHHSTITTPRTVPATLRVTKSGETALRISWSATAAGFRLESSDDLGSNQNWRTVTNAPSINGGEIFITMELSGPARFYRLAQ